MAKKFPPEVEALIKAFCREGYSHRDIVKKLAESNFVVSKTFIHNTLKNVGKRRKAKAGGLPSPIKKCPPRVVTPAIVRKVTRMARRRNPPGFRDIDSSAGLSPRTVRRILAKSKLELRRKTTVYKLKLAHMQNRKTNCRKLYRNWISGNKWSYVVTLDEAMFGLHNTNGQRKICYIPSGQDVPEDWVVNKDNFSVSVMVVAAISGIGTLPLRVVDSKSNMNADYYIKNILTPLVDKDIPSLYPGELHKVKIHHDKTTSHTAQKTAAYAEAVRQKFKIDIIKNSLIPVKSPDVSPMDYFGFGYLKRRMFRRKPKSMQSLCKMLL